MKYYHLNTKQVLKISLHEAWDFFSSPLNLEKITPTYMNFRIVSGHESGRIENGQLIRYKVSPLLGIPLTWVTKIIDVDAPNSFSDTQEKGPYKEWIHTHRFQEISDGVEMIDELRYRLPFGILGRIAHSLFIRKQVESIFEHRFHVLEKRFNQQ